MKSVLIIAGVSCLLLAAFLLVRPIAGGIGEPTRPNITGRAHNHSSAGSSTTNSGATTSSPTVPSPSISRPSPADAARKDISNLEKVEDLILKFTNDERMKAGKGLQPLTADDMLRDTARGHSNDMLYRGFYDHIDPDGLNQAGRIAIQHRRLISRSTGENILLMSGPDTSDPNKIAHEMMYGEKGWMNSEGHKKNILDPDYTHIGIGVSQQGKEIRATQNFAQVKAYTDQPLPYQISKGGSINLTVTGVNGPRADKYDIWSSSQGKKVSEPRDISDSTITIGPGIYKFRFYFPTPSGDGHAVYWGPEVEVN